MEKEEVKEIVTATVEAFYKDRPMVAAYTPLRSSKHLLSERAGRKLMEDLVKHYKGKEHESTNEKS